MRALLFLALSGVAVPACQYEGGTGTATPLTTAAAPPAVSLADVAPASAPTA